MDGLYNSKEWATFELKDRNIQNNHKQELEALLSKQQAELDALYRKRDEFIFEYFSRARFDGWEHTDFETGKFKPTPYHKVDTLSIPQLEFLVWKIHGLDAKIDNTDVKILSHEGKKDKLPSGKYKARLIAFLKQKSCLKCKCVAHNNPLCSKRS